jgi:hypothetical protein
MIFVYRSPAGAQLHESAPRFAPCFSLHKSGVTHRLHDFETRARREREMEMALERTGLDTALVIFEPATNSMIGRSSHNLPDQGY